MKLRFLLLSTMVLIITSCVSKRQIATQNSHKHAKVNKTIPQKETKPSKVKDYKKKDVTKESTIKSTTEYIEKFVPIAVREMHEYKIPASITLAQGILESGSGRSDLAIRSNNHFGIKCHKGWKGQSVKYDDDEIAECFRKYKYPEESYEDHSKFLTNRTRYGSLFKFKTTDYVNWAYGLKKAGYATDSRYPEKLIALIRKYDLDKYDRKKRVSTKVISKETPAVNNINNTGNTRFFYKVIKGDTLYSIARKFNTSVNLLKQLNGLKDNMINIGQELLLKK